MLLCDPYEDPEMLASFCRMRRLCSSLWIWLNSPLGSGFQDNIMVTSKLSMSGTDDRASYDIFGYVFDTHLCI